MPEVVGHWDNLAEAQKLTQSELQAGIVETVIEAGGLISTLPVRQISGQSYLYNREDDWTASDGASFFAIRELIPWSSDMTYTQVSVALKRIARQDPIDNFIANTYNNINDYRAIMIRGLAKRLTRFLEHKIIYGDVTYTGSQEFDGLHALAQEIGGDNDVDGAETAPSFAVLRTMLDTLKIDENTIGRNGVEILMARPLARRLSASVQEAGMIRTSVTHSLGQISFSVNDLGARVMSFDGVPIRVTDYLVAEQANTGAGSDARTVYASGTKQYSILVVRRGAIEDGGLTMLMGTPPGTSAGEFFGRTSFDKLENFDSGGERLVAYPSLALGAKNSLGRIYDLTDAAWTP